ncbi:MAG: hypothetical protein QXH96_00680 [Candidatus Geothermarchaeota archaeon]
MNEGITKNIVIPGFKIKCKLPKRLFDEYFINKVGNEYFSSIVGLLSCGKITRIIPYKEIYRPKRGDYVVGAVIGYAPNGWILEIGSYAKAFLPAVEIIDKHRVDMREDELSSYLSIGDFVGAQISEVHKLGYFVAIVRSSKKKNVILGKIKEYYLLKISTNKASMILSRKNGILAQLREKLKIDIYLANNGVMLFKGGTHEYYLMSKIVDAIESTVELSELNSLISYIEKEGVSYGRS